MGKAVLKFHGAAGTVTGSMHILDLPDGPVSLDCGLYQGRRMDANERNRSFPLNPKDLKCVLLTHAHIDHSGNIPGLVKRGFKGPVYATPATADLCEVMLRDSAHIQEEDARFWNEKRARSKKEYIQPLYTIEDAAQAERQFKRVEYNQRFEFAQGCYATFLEAGHILGSACLLIEIENSEPRKLLYTGDLGRFDVPILRDPAVPFDKVDYLITESTYADRRHRNPSDMKQQLVRIINQTRDIGGKVIIPSFSVGRTQTLVYYLASAIHEGLLEPLPIFVDSPLSVNATEVFKKHRECYDSEAFEIWNNHGDIFGKERITYMTEVEQSKSINQIDDSMVIIASSGMCEAGRIKHHLKNNIEDEKNTVAIVGFMAQHTLGRRIVERREEIKIYGRMYKLLCRVEVLNGFSAHADCEDLKNCLGPIAADLKAGFCVHGEGPQPVAMQQILQSEGCQNALIPHQGMIYEL